MTRARALLAALLLLPAAAQWTQQGGGASRSSVASVRGPSGNTTLLVSDFALPPVLGTRFYVTPVAALPATADAPAVLFFGDSEGVVRALLANGTLLWAAPSVVAEFEYAAPALSADGATVVLVAQVTIVVAPAPIAFGFDARTGALRWSLPCASVPVGTGITLRCGTGLAPPLALPGGDTLVIDSQAVARRVGADAAALRWSAALSSPIKITQQTVFGSFALLERAAAEPLVIVALSYHECRVAAVDAGSGASVWNFTLPCTNLTEFPVFRFDGEPVTNVAVSSTGVVVASTCPQKRSTAVSPFPPDALYALDGATGALLWTTPISYLAHSEILCAENRVAFSPDGARTYVLLAPAATATNLTLLALNVTVGGGAVVWRANFSDGAYATPAVGADDLVFVVGCLGAPLAAGGNSSLVALRGADGSVAWTADLGPSFVTVELAIIDAGQVAVVSSDAVGDGYFVTRVRVFQAADGPPSPSASFSSTPSASLTLGATPSGTPTATATPSGPPTPTPTPTASPTAPPAGDPSPSAAPSGADTVTPSPSRTATKTPSRTAATKTPSQTVTPSPTPSVQPAGAAAGGSAPAGPAIAGASVGAVLLIICGGVFANRRKLLGMWRSRVAGPADFAAGPADFADPPARTASAASTAFASHNPVPREWPRVASAPVVSCDSPLARGLSRAAPDDPTLLVPDMADVEDPSSAPADVDEGDMDEDDRIGTPSVAAVAVRASDDDDKVRLLFSLPLAPPRRAPDMDKATIHLSL